MELIRKTLDEIQEINSFYQLSNNPIKELLDDMKSSKVSLPIIGKFSAGKSALLNSLLGYSRPMLKEAITPETAVPTEISYALEDSVLIVNLNKEIEQTNISNFRAMEYDAESVNFIQLLLRNDQFLANIPDIMMVDMPGFESGYEVHNRAIDRYLPQSLAYTVAFPADDMVLKASMRNILNELNLHQMPICIVITKHDKVSEDILLANLTKLKDDINRCINRHDQITYCITSSHEGDIDDLKQFLFDIQEQSQQLLGTKYRQSVIYEADKTSAYLSTVLQNNNLSLSELEEQEDLLKNEMNALNKKIEDDQEQFVSQIPAIVREIQADVRSTLQEAENTLVTMILNNQEIVEKVNLITRESLTRSIQQRFLPKIQRYMKKISESIQIDIFADMGFATNRFNIDTDGISKKIINGVVAGISLVIFGPIFTAIGMVTKYFIGKSIQNKKREEIKSQIKQKLTTDVFPNIISQVGATVEIELKKHLQVLNTNITGEIATQREILEKALVELKSERTKEQLINEQLLVKARLHLQRIEELKHGL